jgi:hypothetical protein
MHLRILLLLAVLAVFINSRACKEGWRPFAWYGYPGVKSGEMGYQARGDWCGIIPGTTTQDKPLPLVPFKPCSRQQTK